jgi:hypothetical protein
MAVITTLSVWARPLASWARGLERLPPTPAPAQTTPVPAISRAPLTTSAALPSEASEKTRSARVHPAAGAAGKPASARTVAAAPARRPSPASDASTPIPTRAPGEETSPTTSPSRRRRLPAKTPVEQHPTQGIEPSAADTAAASGSGG